MGTVRYPTKSCSSCGASIIWAITSSGGRMPVDAEPVKDGNIVLRQPGLDEVFAHVRRENSPQLATPYYVSHFVTCPNANQHRKRRS